MQKIQRLNWADVSDDESWDENETQPTESMTKIHQPISKAKTILATNELRKKLKSLALPIVFTVENLKFSIKSDS